MDVLAVTAVALVMLPPRTCTDNAASLLEQSHTVCRTVAAVSGCTIKTHYLLFLAGSFPSLGSPFPSSTPGFVAFLFSVFHACEYMCTDASFACLT